MAYKIKVYGTPVCTWCAKTKQLSGENNIAYEDIDVSKDIVAFKKIINETMWMTVPVIDMMVNWQPVSVRNGLSRN